MFLSEISIKNLAIIEDIKINFFKGLNVISGETGAGKSIIIKAITLLLGEKSNSSIVRPDREFSSIQAVFEEAGSINSLLDIYDIECLEELSIRRIIYKNGKSKAYVNDTFVSQKILSEIGISLVSILSQNEHQKLFDNNFQLELLDKFLSLDKERLKLTDVYNSWKNELKKLEQLKERQAEGIKRSDYLKFQIREIEELTLKEDEEDALIDFIKKEDNASEILKITSGSLDLISYSEESVYSKINNLILDFSKYRELGNDFELILSNINDLLVKLEELERVLNKVAKSYELDSEDVNYKRDRLAEIKRLKKKFSVNTLTELLDNYSKMKEELKSLDNLDDAVINLELKVKELESNYLTLAKNLSNKRKKNNLSKKIEDTLQELGLLSSDFKVLFSDINPSSTGIDRIEFLIRTNPGMPMEPIAKIASGGEISRIMLSIQAATNEIYGYGVQIFDEVDAGIGGDVGFKVGKLLKLTSKNHQVIVITHLPQIAVYAAWHIKVGKSVKNKETIVDVKNLNKNDSLNEISRMFGMLGDKATIENIKNMITKVVS
jgi:DNA repair protein RecN (Recombination protein N)